MSSTNQRLIEQAKDDYNTDYARQCSCIFGEVYQTRPAYERKQEKIKEFNRTWGIDKMNEAMGGFRVAVKSAIESSEERNKAVEKLLNSF